jgi:hypothetical protein
MLSEFLPNEKGVWGTEFFGIFDGYKSGHTI